MSLPVLSFARLKMVKNDCSVRVLGPYCNFSVEEAFESRRFGTYCSNWLKLNPINYLLELHHKSVSSKFRVPSSLQKHVLIMERQKFMKAII